jgi:hypothetical protein
MSSPYDNSISNEEWDLSKEEYNAMILVLHANKRRKEKAQ